MRGAPVEVLSAMSSAQQARLVHAKVSLPLLFWEWFKIALFVVGGGYAIIVVADEVFGRKKKWIGEGELIGSLPIISSIPGLIAGNSAIYVGLKIRGRIGATVALAGAALPSILIFLCVTIGFSAIPRGNIWIAGVFLGLRSALSGLIAGTMWRTLFKSRANWSNSIGVRLAPLSRKGKIGAFVAFSLFVFVSLVFARESFVSFLEFGCIAIGGGFPLVPFYLHAFVGPNAAMLNMDPVDFSNAMALTQMTPGPVSLNAATFFGYRLNGVIGSLVASVSLLIPSYFMLSAVLGSIDRLRGNKAIRGFLLLLKPVSVFLLAIALWNFCSISIWNRVEGGGVEFRPHALALAVFSAVMLLSRRMPIMLTIFICAALGAVSVAVM